MPSQPHGGRSSRLAVLLCTASRTGAWAAKPSALPNVALEHPSLQEALRPTLCAEQLEQLRQARRQWVCDMGRVLAVRGYRLARLQLHSWHAAAAAMQAGGPGGAASVQAGPAAGGGTLGSGAGAAGVPGGGGPATPSAAAAGAAPAAAAAAAGSPAGSTVAPARGTVAYAGMAAAGQWREQLLRELRGLDDTYQRGFGCLATLVIAMLQVGRHCFLAVLRCFVWHVVGRWWPCCAP